MKRLLSLLLATALLNCQTPHRNSLPPKLQLQTKAPETVPQLVEQVIEHLRLTMLEKVLLIWSHYNWEALQVLFVYPSQKWSYLWTVYGDSLAAVASKSLPTETQGLYTLLQINGRETLTLNLEDPHVHFSHEAWAGLAVHEFFHFVGQRNWQHIELRTTTYPQQVAPRFYRHMTYQALAAYWRGISAQGLGHARYWHERWKQEFPYELQRATDNMEGTASYVEAMTLAMLHLQTLGKELNEQNLHSFLLEHEDLFSRYLNIAAQASLDNEGYALGGLAASMLRFDSAKLGLSLEDWNQLVAGGQQLLDILLQDTEPLEQAPDTALLEKLTGLIEAANQALAPAYNLLISQYQDPANYVRVRLPWELLYSQGNLRPRDFAFLEAIGHEAIQLAQPHSLVSPGKTRLKIEGAFIDQQHNIVIMLPRSLFRQTQAVQVIHIVDGPVSGELHGRLSQQDQIRYFMAE